MGAPLLPQELSEAASLRCRRGRFKRLRTPGGGRGKAS
eukprot:CAMPEP_0180533684 /NCGR_PEP_ID=MMETSP1036_2-20121128/63747_1 /TAXON_ID=632150 /ORGANISM="Azadinium spinosum, Strain 3D9" /LENGTH=37 /DNA_ID= /DNA_START= /DNA_END= /DNA_ORIENTATION=